MFLIVGYLVVIGALMVGYIWAGGKMVVLLAPLPKEMTIIFGMALGAFLAGNPMSVIKAVAGSAMMPLKGPKYSKAAYMEALMMQYEVYVNIKKGGLLALEQDVNDPHSSSIFKKYSILLHDHHSLDFYCDSMKLLINGSAKIDEIDKVMEADLDLHHSESAEPGAALNVFADSMPAFGIVACVVGVVVTMGFLDQPPNVIGGKVGGALIGTMLGIVLSYGFFAPLAKHVDSLKHGEGHFFNCLRAGLLAFGNGAAPVTAVEFARRSVPGHDRPGAQELEEVVRQIKPR